MISFYCPKLNPMSSFNNYVSFIEREHKFENKSIGLIYWWDLTSEEKNVPDIERFVSEQDICFFVSEEILDTNHFKQYDELFTTLNKYNTFYIIYSHELKQKITTDKKRIFHVPWFFKQSLYYQNYKIQLDWKVKNYDFNMLLGTKKPYRTILYNIYKNNPKIYTTYFGASKSKQANNHYLEDEDILEKLLDNQLEEKLCTVVNIERENKIYWLSHIAPKKIYDNTHFDVVTETIIENGYNFLTEKTAKPLATGRYFLWMSQPNTIDYLNQFGFSTEEYFLENKLVNYDRIPDSLYRLSCMVENINEIISNEKLVEEIYVKTKKVREHNIQVYQKNINDFEKNLLFWIYECFTLR